MNSKTNTHVGAPKRIRVLIADDSFEFRRAVGLLLKRLPGVELVAEAEDGEDALALVASTRPDLVLMDLQMPRLNGLEATVRIRGRFPDVRVIVITIHDSEEWKATCARAGADRFIPKNRLCCELPGAITELFPGPVLSGCACEAEDKQP